MPTKISNEMWGIGYKSMEKRRPRKKHVCQYQYPASRMAMECRVSTQEIDKFMKKRGIEPIHIEHSMWGTIKRYYGYDAYLRCLRHFKGSKKP